MKATTRLSGTYYIAAYLKEAEPAFKTGRPRYEQLPISEPTRCSHVSSICIECWDIWSEDWVLLFDTTIGGRTLKARIER